MENLHSTLLRVRFGTLRIRLVAKALASADMGYTERHEIACRLYDVAGEIELATRSAEDPAGTQNNKGGACHDG